MCYILSWFPGSAGFLEIPVYVRIAPAPAQIPPSTPNFQSPVDAPKLWRSNVSDPPTDGQYPASPSTITLVSSDQPDSLKHVVWLIPPVSCTGPRSPRVVGQSNGAVQSIAITYSLRFHPHFLQTGLKKRLKI